MSQTVISRAGADLDSLETSARIDPKRTVTAGRGEDFKGAVWVAVVGPREEVASDAAKKLAAAYPFPGTEGAIDRAHGPIPDGPNVAAPREPGYLSGAAATAVTSMETYSQRAAAMNIARAGDRCVCFYLVRPSPA
jgi:hypothetical protein